ncbi:MAG: TonB-dependent receptor [Saprospiraceae bacterium]|nr:TonB-dependent receptor [Saprospiraceae bacterium]
MKRTVLFIFFSLMYLLQLEAQRIVNGTVQDATGSPLIGASVYVVGTTTGTVSDANGRFSIKMNEGQQLQISLVGYNPVTISDFSNPNLIINMEPSMTALEQVVVVGTRRANRIQTETPVPVDVLQVSQMQFPTAKMDVTSMLNFAAPSFNYAKQSGSDGADHIDLGTLRGMGPDQTLVLINGKRRHQTAFVSVFGTRGRGNSGTDLNAIPQSSIDRIEILRDGASAQYGSDAIAGVMNIILKKNPGKLTGSAGYAAYYDNKYNTILSKDQGYQEYDKKMDGATFNVGANYGISLGSKGGFLNIGADFAQIDKTYRQDPDQILPFNIYRRTHGDGSVDAYGGMANLELPLMDDNKLNVYAFGGYNFKKSDAFAFTRRFDDNPERFPTDDQGNLIPVPGIIKATADGSSFYYNPHIQTEIKDLSGVAGLKGQLGSGWDWDLSGSYGKNDFHFFGDQTFNAGLGASKTHFDDGGFSFSQAIGNLDIGKEFPSILSGLHLGLGAEFRSENYQLTAGEEASYANYNVDKPSGSQGFPGYQPGDEADETRSTFGFYTDLELDVTKSFLVAGAVRLENYSDFGFTDNYKLAARYKVDNMTTLRGSVSTGFRAPSLQQINFSSTFTTVQGGLISEVKIAPNSSPITKAAGIPELKEEVSTNYNVGVSIRPKSNITFSVDAYRVIVKDRVVLSGQFSADDQSLSAELRQTLQDLKVSYAQFFANAVNTTNSGVDVVLDCNHKCGMGSLRYLFTGNVQRMEIDKINVPKALSTSASNIEYFYSVREQNFLLASAPKTKFGMSLDYNYKRWTIGTRVNYFGQVNLYGYGDFASLLPEVPTDADENVRVADLYLYKPKWVQDIYASARIINGLTLYLGLDNIWNEHPDLGYVPGTAGWAYNNETGGPWDAVQMGGNGRKLFARLGFNF